MDPSDRIVEFDRSGAHLTVYLGGELDTETLEPLTDAITSRIRPGDERVWLDLREVVFCGSAGLTLLLRLNRHVHALGGILTLYQPSPAVTRLLEVTKLGRNFSIWEERAPQRVEPPIASATHTRDA
jgi:anti-sigma B factor antagonist